MENELEGYECLNGAEELLKKAELAETETEVTHLIKVVETSIKELVATSYSKTQISPTYKVLNNALKLLNNKDKPKEISSGFSFKPIIRAETSENSQTKETTFTPVGTRKPISNEPTFVYKERCVIKNLKGKRIFRNQKTPNEVASVVLENLENCEIIMLNTVESTYVSNVRNSIIWIAIAKSSVIADSISGTVFIASCRQLRISNGINCRLFVDTVTSPIIESSKCMKFAKNHIQYPNYKEDLKESGLEGDILEKQESVVDFSWHNSEKSPNWEIHEPKAEYLVKIIDLEEIDEYNTQTITDLDWNTIKSL